MAEGEQEDDSQKTEEPTPKKIDEARKKGQVALSREVNNWVMLFTGTVVILAIGPSAMSRLSDHMETYIARAHVLPSVPGGFGMLMGDSFITVLWILMLPLLIFIVAAISGPLFQVGPLIAPEVIKPDLSKLSVFKGFKRLFSMRSIMEFVKGIVKIGVVGVVILWAFPFPP